MQMSYLYASDFPFKNFCKTAQHTETIRNVWEKGNDAYSSIRVQTTINHISILTFLCFIRQYFFLSERELKEALRDTFGFDWFVLSMCIQVILDSSFARPGSAPIWGGKKGKFRDWTKTRLKGAF